MSKEPQNNVARSKGPNLFGLLKPYARFTILLLILSLLGSGLNLLLPKLIATSIDAYTSNTLALQRMTLTFLGVAVLVFVFAYLQSIVQTYTSERVARDLRAQLSAKISRQSYLAVQTANPSKLLTNLTSDIDSVKLFISQAVVSITSSLVIIIGASILLLTLNWKLGLAVIAILPIIAAIFFVILGKVRALFLETRQVIDWLNNVINESILGAALIRVLHSHDWERHKFIEVNTKAKDLGMRILAMFASMIPAITFVANIGTLIILAYGGHLVITQGMSLGTIAAFNSYLALLIFPIFVIGFMSNIIAQASASYQRVKEVLDATEIPDTGTITTPLEGTISLKNISLAYGEKLALKNISIEIKGGTKTAIIGPTAAGKTQLLYLLTGLTRPDTGTIEFDGKNLRDYQTEKLHQQVGFVFQDSIIFNMSVRENVAFNGNVTEESLQKAMETAELSEFVDTLPQKIDTIVSERGSDLSGGQKQRVMLARALALDPTILLLDDFTARVDSQTEQRILSNITINYPNLTLISVTQKIAPVESYDQIILLMEGEVLAAGTHEALLHSSPEYVQIYNSQRSTSSYELHAE